jgi:hypothetical protein
VDDCARARRLAACRVDLLATNLPRDMLVCLGYR